MASMIDRFRNGKPTAPEERHRAREEGKLSEMWWIEKDQGHGVDHPSSGSNAGLDRRKENVDNFSRNARPVDRTAHSNMDDYEPRSPLKVRSHDGPVGGRVRPSGAGGGQDDNLDVDALIAEEIDELERRSAGVSNYGARARGPAREPPADVLRER